MAAQYAQVVLYGDSLIQRTADLDRGFSLQANLQQRCIRRFDVINRGFSGWNTKNALEYLGKIFPERVDSSPEIKYLVVLFGANDATLEHSSQHVPIDNYKENLTKIITHPRVRAHKPRILLVTPPPLDEIHMKETDLSFDQELSRRTAVTQKYAQKVREIANENPGVVLVDLEKALMDKAELMTPDDFSPTGPRLGSFENGQSGGLKGLLVDGLHLSREGYEVFDGELQKNMGEEWNDLAGNDRTKYVFPDWATLNPPNN